MKRQIAFLVSAMMTVNLFTAVPAFATDDFSDAEVVVEEDSNEDAEEMEIQDSTEEDFEDEGAVTEDSAASEQMWICFQTRILKMQLQNPNS